MILYGLSRDKGAPQTDTGGLELIIQEVLFPRIDISYSGQSYFRTSQLDGDNELYIPEILQTN